tara:strand:+ start:194 stop:901 length:708 start_codon:yes stop_codon:yes gene_type:complete
VSNAAIATRISVTSNPQPIIDLLEDFVSKDFDAKGKPVYVNGVYVGAVKELDSGEDAALNLASILRHHRSSRVIPFDVTIANEDTRLSIWTDSGRLIRPVFRVKNGAINIRDNVVEDLIQKRINFDDLISLGAIEFIDALETEKMLIALYPKHLTDEHTHCEISPSLILGTMASTIPFADNNQSPAMLVWYCMASPLLQISCAYCMLYSVSHRQSFSLCQLDHNLGTHRPCTYHC